MVRIFCIAIVIAAVAGSVFAGAGTLGAQVASGTCNNLAGRQMVQKFVAAITPDSADVDSMAAFGSYTLEGNDVFKARYVLYRASDFGMVDTAAEWVTTTSEWWQEDVVFPPKASIGTYKIKKDTTYWLGSWGNNPTWLFGYCQWTASGTSTANDSFYYKTTTYGTAWASTFSTTGFTKAYGKLQFKLWYSWAEAATFKARRRRMIGTYPPTEKHYAELTISAPATTATTITR